MGPRNRRLHCLRDKLEPSQTQEDLLELKLRRKRQALTHHKMTVLHQRKGGTFCQKTSNVGSCNSATLPGFELFAREQHTDARTQERQ